MLTVGGHTLLRLSRIASHVVTPCPPCVTSHFAYHWLVTLRHRSLRHPRTASHVDMSCWHSVTHHYTMLTPFSGHWAMVTLRNTSLRHIYTASHITTPCWHCFYVTESHVVTRPYVIIHCAKSHYVMHPFIITTRLDWIKHSRFQNAIMFMLFHTRCSNSIHMTRSCAPLWSYGWQIWTDVGLQWDPDKYGGIRVVRVPYDEVWRPDILLYNKWVYTIQARWTKRCSQTRLHSSVIPIKVRPDILFYNKWVYTMQARWTKGAVRLVCICQWYQLRSGRHSALQQWVYARQARWTKSALRLVCICQW